MLTLSDCSSPARHVAVQANGADLAAFVIDISSQCTGSGAIEYKSIQRQADLYLYTFTYNRI